MKVWETSAVFPYWWRVTTQIWIVLLNGRATREICFNQSEALSRSGWWRVVSVISQTSFHVKTIVSAAKCRLSSHVKMSWAAQGVAIGAFLKNSHYFFCELNDAGESERPWSDRGSRTHPCVTRDLRLDSKTRTTRTIDLFSNRTGTSVDDGALKSNYRLDRWQSGKLSTGSRL